MIGYEKHTNEVLQIWDTANVGRSEAFDYYREAICSAFMPLRPKLDKRQRKLFHASVRSHQLVGGVLNRVTAQSHDVYKGAKEIAASPQDCYYLNLQCTGDCQIEQGGKNFVLHPGDIALFDGAEVFDLKHDKHPTLAVNSLLIPKTLLQERCDNLPDGVPIMLSHHLIFGGLLFEGLSSLASAVEYETQDVISDLYELVLSLASKAIDTRGRRPSLQMRSDANFHRIILHIRMNYADQAYSITDCAANVHLSVGYIRNLFTKHDDSFGRFLLRERLKRAAEVLSNPLYSHIPVYAVADMVGFKDTSHFSRAFRQCYQCSPSDWRKQC